MTASNATRPVRFELGLQQCDGLVDVGGRLAGAAVQELERRRRVLGAEVDVTRLERGEHDVAETAELPAATTGYPALSSACP